MATSSIVQRLTLGAVARQVVFGVSFGAALAGLPLTALAQSRPPVSRPTVSVPAFKNTVTQPTWWWQGPVADDLAAALANELQGTGALQVVERRQLKDVLSEQELA